MTHSMQHYEPLESGKLYHIYNHGVVNRDLFREVNHFHLLVRIRGNIVYKYSNADRSADPVGFEQAKWQTVEIPSHPAIRQRPKDLSALEVLKETKVFSVVPIYKSPYLTGYQHL